ncbi:Actin regulatory protein (Wiskott-Aldrich syndrome protein) [Gracilaria domingensis]|nr:Actin regulatory protein (Wiskott-Aldrich syndrome protein) [Gracilaria domingensis]
MQRKEDEVTDEGGDGKQSQEEDGAKGKTGGARGLGEGVRLEEEGGVEELGVLLGGGRVHGVGVGGGVHVWERGGGTQHARRRRWTAAARRAARQSWWRPGAAAAARAADEAPRRAAAVAAAAAWRAAAGKTLTLNARAAGGGAARRWNGAAMTLCGRGRGEKAARAADQGIATCGALIGAGRVWRSCARCVLATPRVAARAAAC